MRSCVVLFCYIPTLDSSELYPMLGADKNKLIRPDQLLSITSLRGVFPKYDSYSGGVYEPLLYWSALDYINSKRTMLVSQKH